MNPVIRSSLCRVLTAAIRAREEGRANVFVDYTPHVDRVYVHANPISQKYEGEDHVHVLREDIKISGDMALGHAELLIKLEDIRHQIDGLDTRETIDDLGREWA